MDPLPQKTMQPKVEDHQLTTDTSHGQMQQFSLPPDRRASWASFVPGPSPSFRLRSLSPGANRHGVVVCGCAMFCLSGFNIALMGSVSSSASYLHVVGLSDTSKQTQLLIGVVNSIYWVGVICGALLVGWFSDRVGRRKAVVCAACYGLLIVPILATLQNFAWALSLRLLNGFATGALDSVCLNWSAETSSHKHRGRTIGLELCWAALGASIAYFLSHGLTQDTASEAVWRAPLAFQCVPILIILAMIWFLPESPRWLIKVGMIEEARDILLALKGVEETDNDDIVLLEIDSIAHALQEETLANASATYTRMLFARDACHTARRVWSALFIQFATEFLVGAGLVAGYGIQLLSTAGWSSHTSSLLSGFAIVAQALAGIPGAFLADKMGRRPALFWGSLICGCLICLMGMCGYFVEAYTSEENLVRAKAYAVGTVVILYIWTTVFGLTWLGTPFTYPSELFPARSRARGTSFGVVGFASGAFLCNMVSPYLFSALGYRVFFMLCGLSLFTAMVVFCFMPETGNLTLEEVDGLYEKKNTVVRRWY